MNRRDLRESRHDGRTFERRSNESFTRPHPVISGEEEFVQIKFLQPSFSRPFSLQHPCSTLAPSSSLLIHRYIPPPVSFIRRNSFSFFLSFFSPWFEYSMPSNAGFSVSRAYIVRKGRRGINTMPRDDQAMRSAMNPLPLSLSLSSP